MGCVTREEGSQTLNTDPLKCRAKHFSRFGKGEKGAFYDRKCCRAGKFKRGIFCCGLGVDPGHDKEWQTEDIWNAEVASKSKKGNF